MIFCRVCVHSILSACPFVGRFVLFQSVLYTVVKGIIPTPGRGDGRGMDIQG